MWAKLHPRGSARGVSQGILPSFDYTLGPSWIPSRVREQTPTSHTWKPPVTPRWVVENINTIVRGSEDVAALLVIMYYAMIFWKFSLMDAWYLWPLKIYVLNKVDRIMPISYEDPDASLTHHCPVKKPKIRPTTLKPQTTEEIKFDRKKESVSLPILY